ncbi:MAG: polyprenyl synthetase family protein [Patescibacteria group bacterium]|nr:polyprenyl synthetase family protein [Patescibacteria group bacterium]
MNDLKEFKKTFDPILKQYLDKKIQAFSKDLHDPFILDIVAYSQKLTLSGGKRIRPFIAYLIYKALGGKEIPKALELFISLELFHNFALIHDDIMDKSPMRHNVQTVHEYVKEKLEKEGRFGNLKHIGNSQAILLGDILLSWAFSVFDEVDLDENKLGNARLFFNKMADDVFLGQIIDIDIASRKDIPQELIDKKDTLKTASYTFIKPLQIGASLIGIDEKTEKFCEDLGLNLGLAFQLQDDLLDSENTETKENTLRKIEEYLARAKVAIEKSDLNENNKTEFYKFIDSLKNRSH